MVGPRLYTTAGLSDRTPAWALHIIEYTAPAPLLQPGSPIVCLSSSGFSARQPSRPRTLERGAERDGDEPDESEGE